MTRAILTALEEARRLGTEAGCRSAKLGGRDDWNETDRRVALGVESATLRRWIREWQADAPRAGDAAPQG